MDSDPTKQRKPPVYYPRSDDLCSQTEHVTIKNVWFGFKAFTTAHGVPHVDQAKGSYKRGWWMLLTLAGVAVMLQQMYTITITYRSNPVTPIVVKQSSRELTFPAVTVCNTNPVKSSALHLSPALNGLVESWEEGKKRKKREVDVKEILVIATVDRQSEMKEEGETITQSNIIDESETITPSEIIEKIETTRQSQKMEENETIRQSNMIDESETVTEGSETIRQSKVIDESETVRQPGEYRFLEKRMEASRADRLSEIKEKYESIRVSQKYSATTGTETKLNDASNNNDKELLNQPREHHHQTASPGIDQSDLEHRYIQTDMVDYHSVTSGNNRDITHHQTTESLSNENSMRGKRAIGSIRHFCSVAYPHGTFCLIDEPSTADSSESLCEELGQGYTLASLETKDKVKDAEDSFFFLITLHSNTYIIGLYNDPYFGLSWLSGEHYSYNQWDENTPTDGNFNYTKVRIKSGESHIWQPASDQELGLPLCFVDNYADIPTTSTESTTTTQSTSTTTEITTESTTAPTTTTTQPSIHPDREPIREDFQQTNDFLETLADLPEDVKVELGYQSSEFILECVYDGEDCINREFGHFFDSTHGNCYSFNSGWNGDSLLPARRQGRSSGLSMTLNIGQYDFMPGISDIAGVVVVVHSQTRMPFPEDEGVLGHPGQLTSVGISQVTVDRLGGKYSDCFEEDKDPDRNVFEEHHRVNYSAAGCYKTCYQKHLIETCSCYDPQYPGTGSALGSTVVPVCDTRNRVQDDCMYGVLLEYIGNNLSCDCPIKCYEEMYVHSISRARWPSLVAKDAVVAKHADKLTRLLNYSTEESYLYRNLLKIEVYFDELNYKYVYEKPKYPMSLYMADFASLMGLFLGLSVLSIAEIVELIADLIVVSLKKILKLNKPRMREFSSASLEIATNGRPPERNAGIPKRYSSQFSWSTTSRKSFPGAWVEKPEELVVQQSRPKPRNMLTNYTQMLVLGKFKRAAKRNKTWNSYF